MIFPTLHLSNKEKKKKRNINIDLAVLPSHDINDIWINNEKKVTSPKINNFLWKLCHNRHKVETWFLKIKD